MRKALVLDASTAILLAKIGMLRQVTDLGEVWMAHVAFEEATAKDVEDARAIRRLAEEKRILVAGPAKQGSRFEKDFRLDSGEAESIALAMEKEAICGTDDGPAIRCLRVLGQPFTTAVTLLVAMAETGLITKDLAVELLAKLERVGRYDPRILEDAARKIRGGGKT